MSSDARTESGILLSGGDARALLELIHTSLSCNTLEEYKSLFTKLQDLIPFKYASSLVADFNDGDVMQCEGFNISFPDEYRTIYKAKGLLNACVIAKEHFRTFRPQFWPDTAKKAPQSEEILSLCSDFGFYEGYSHGSRSVGPGGKASLFWFSTSSPACDKRIMTILELVIPHFHNALCHVFNKRMQEKYRVVLSAREKEVLDWLKHGKSSWDISVILGLSERTVNFHVYNIMHKLGAVNRPQAVAIATRLGLIDI